MKLKKVKHNEIFESNFSRLKVITMNIFHLLAPAQFLRLVKQPKIISNFTFFDTFFETRDKIPPQILENLVVGMPKRVFEVNREK